jgi:hypothetical protein
VPARGRRALAIVASLNTDPSAKGGGLIQSLEK